MLGPLSWAGLFVGREIGVIIDHFLLIFTRINFSPQGCLRALVFHVMLVGLSVVTAVLDLKSFCAFDLSASCSVSFLMIGPHPTMRRLDLQAIFFLFEFRMIQVSFVPPLKGQVPVPGLGGVDDERLCEQILSCFVLVLILEKCCCMWLCNLAP
jgi:hypothetical protein